MSGYRIRFTFINGLDLHLPMVIICYIKENLVEFTGDRIKIMKNIDAVVLVQLFVGNPTLCITRKIFMIFLWKIKYENPKKLKKQRVFFILNGKLFKNVSSSYHPIDYCSKIPWQAMEEMDSTSKIRKALAVRIKI